MKQLFLPSALIFGASFLITLPFVIGPLVRADDTPLSIAVSGNHFVDQNGNTVVPRGVNFSGFEFVPVQGWSPNDPSGDQGGQAQGPDYAAITSWGANIVRIPLNEASWLGYTCTDSTGATHNPDPGGNYQADVAKQVQEANAQGLYVILDLHWAAPGSTCPMLQTQMADADHSIAFWTSVANTYKNNPSVMFELYNEPYFNFDYSGTDAWATMMRGTDGAMTGYPATSDTGQWKNIQTTWTVASYQDLINAVRATGARNVVLVGTMQYDQDFSKWLAEKPADPLGQMAAVWHPYPTFGTSPGQEKYAEPNGAPAVYNQIQNILSAGIPVLATETGDHNTRGTKDAPLVSNVTKWADANGIGVLGWGWDVWEDSDNVLITDASGTPTDGYGKAFKKWLQDHNQDATSSPSSTTPPVPAPPNKPPTPPPDSQPYIQSFSPDSGPVGTTVTFVGHDFTDLKVAWMGTNHAIPVRVLSDTEAQVIIPADAKTGQVGLLVDEHHASFAATPFVVTSK